MDGGLFLTDAECIALEQAAQASLDRAKVASKRLTEAQAAVEAFRRGE